MISTDKFKEVENSSIVLKHSYYKILFCSLFKKISFILPVSILISLFIVSFVSNYFIDKEMYMNINFENSFISPNKEYPFGTNDFGQNLLYQVLIGCYNTLKLSIIATLINLITGVIIGVIWGSSTKFDGLMLFIKTIFDNIPIIFFYIIIISALGNNFISLLIVIIVFGWINIACLVRNNLLLIRNKDYNKASKLYKTSLIKRTVNNYLPSMLPIIFNSAALSIPDVISFEITVSYYGFNIGKENISLGKLLYNSISNNNCFTHPYMFFIPLAFLFVINICFYYIGKAISSASMKDGDLNVRS